MRRMVGVVLALVVVGFAIQARQRQGDPVARVPGTTAREAIDAAAAALGGADRILEAEKHHVDRIRAVRLSERRWQHHRRCPARRRSSSPPTTTVASTTSNTAACCIRSDATICFRLPTTAATTSRCRRQVLDGDVAYNINAKGQAARGGDVRDRRMWMHTNPVVAVRAALDRRQSSSEPSPGKRI